MKSLVLALAVLLTACAGTNFKTEDVAKIHEGMTEAEVVTILGPPYQRVQTAGFTILTWSYAQAFGGAKAVSYRFVGGKVAASTTVGR
jgi:outer membrane protein assembly factor BamE (lipoprotein component of BamABCDE complex)